jgi:hypothetical protein
MMVEDMALLDLRAPVVIYQRLAAVLADVHADSSVGRIDAAIAGRRVTGAQAIWHVLDLGEELWSVGVVAPLAGYSARFTLRGRLGRHRLSSVVVIVYT